MNDVAVADEHSGYEPDEITLLSPGRSLGDVNRALAYYDPHRRLQIRHVRYGMRRLYCNERF